MLRFLRDKRFLPLVLLLLIVLGGFGLITAHQYKAATLSSSYWQGERIARNRKTVAVSVLLDLTRISNLSHQAIIHKTAVRQQDHVDRIRVLIQRLKTALDALADPAPAQTALPEQIRQGVPPLPSTTTATVDALFLKTMLDDLSRYVQEIPGRTSERNRILSTTGGDGIRQAELSVRAFVTNFDAFGDRIMARAHKLDREVDQELATIQKRIEMLQRRTRLFSLAWGSVICLAVLGLIGVVYRQLLDDRTDLEKTVAQTRQAEEALRQVNSQVQTLNKSLENQIHERTRQLARSEKQWRDAFDAVASPILIHNREGRILKANKAYLDMAGKPLAEVQNAFYWEIFPKNLGPFYGMPQASPHGLEIVARERIFSVRFYAVEDETGDASCTLLRIDDITEQRATVDRLEKYRQIISTDKNLIAFVNRDHTYLAANDLYARSLGYEVASIIGQHVRDVIGSGRYEGETRQCFDRCLAGEEVTFEGWQALPRMGRRLIESSFIPFYDENGGISGLVWRCEDVTDIREAGRQLEFQALHHPLTQLPNSRLLHQRLHEAIARAHRQDSRGAVLYIDLDNFKHINDSLGHSAGDALLLEVAQRLERTQRIQDTVAHLSGDEFVVLINDLGTAEAACEEAGQILHLLKKPFFYNSTELFLSGSVGISLYPDDSCEVEVLMKNADAALHKAKELGKNQYYRFAPELTRAAQERVVVEGYLQRALEKRELVLYYQPQIRLNDRKVVACEALVRWQHPELGLVTPDRFIPLAEETGLIVPFGEWILRTACAQWVTWRTQGLVLDRIAVNVSGRQIQEKHLEAMVKRVLDETGCPPEAVELEITEGFIMRHPEQSIRLLQRLRRIGVMLSVDDFGTGHSSLSYLKRLPINRLKIDRSFVKDIQVDPNDEEIVKAIIALGNSLGLEITAEGIETEGQLRYLAKHGCQEGQGFLISRPVPAEQCARLLTPGA